MLDYYGVKEKRTQLKDWYDGYTFGRKEIYNPWSVINYISRGCQPQAYWVNTGQNEVLREVLSISGDTVTKKLRALLQGETVIAKIDQNVVFRSLKEDPSSVYSLLLVAGYLKYRNKELQNDGTWQCEVAIPNREVSSVYKSEILSHLVNAGAVSKTAADTIAESLYRQDITGLENGITEYISKSVSYYDSSSESFYHGLILGLIAMMDSQYQIKSNRESGNGRYDISMFPRSTEYPGIIMELKAGKRLTEKALESLSNEALRQIDEKNYAAEQRAHGAEHILKIGIAFSDKKVKITTNHSF